MHWILPGVLQSRAVSPASVKTPRPFCLATFGRKGSREKKGVDAWDFMSMSCLRFCHKSVEIVYRISFLPVQFFYLHFLTLCSDMAWPQRQAINDSGEMLFPSSHYR